MNEPTSQTPIYTDSPEEPKNSGLKDTLSTIGVILLAPLVAFFLISFVFQSYQVDGPSMEPTLQDQDRLIVSKTGKTWSRLNNEDYIPKRYDIVIFNLTSEFDNNGQVDKKQLVKRVIGLPGDRVVIKNGLVTVYNNQNPSGFLVDKEGPASESIGETDTEGDIDETVKDGTVYIMGDNRDNSLDSRVFGTVRSQDIVGKLSVRIFPFDQFDTF